MISIILSVGSGEIFLILLAALILFGPKRLPEVARNLGKGVREFKKMKEEFTKEITKDDTISKEIKEINDNINKDLS